MINNKKMTGLGFKINTTGLISLVSALMMTWAMPVGAAPKKETVSHAGSQITVISDDFTVPNITVETDSDHHLETALLQLGPINTGFVRFHRVKVNTFCGFSATYKWELIAPKGGLEKISLENGGPSFTGERQGRRIKNNQFISYREGAGEKLYCVAMSVMTKGAGVCGNGGGNEIAYSLICLPKDNSDVSSLTDKSLSMLTKLRTDGSGKELIKSTN